MTHYQAAEGLPATTPWMTEKLAIAMSSDVGLMALKQFYEGHSNLSVSYSFARSKAPEEDYTCDKCREYHPAGLNVALFGIGHDVDAGHATIQNPMDLMEWSRLLVRVGLCHRCWAEEGYPHNPLADIDPGFVQQAVRLIEIPPLDVLT